jgi:L-malate glycosyltransferase
MAKRKVLILASWYPDDRFPLNGIFIQDQVLALSEQYDVVVLTPNIVSWKDWLRGRLGPEPGVEKRAGVDVYRERPQVPVLRVPVLGYQTYAEAARRGLEKMMGTWGKPDLIHAHVVLPGGFAAVQLGKRFKVPVVLTEHTGPFSIHLRTRYQRHLVRETLEGIDHLIAVSPSLLEHIHAFDKDFQFSVIGELVKTGLFVPPEAVAPAVGDKTRFLAVALLRPGKGLEDLVRATQLLVEHGETRFEVIIGGDGPERQKLQGMAAAAGVANYCRFLGRLAADEVCSEMQRCDVFVLPSHHETFGIVYGEAMACGKPVIGTHCGGPEFVVTSHTGVLVEVANPGMLADTMKSFISKRITFDPKQLRQSVTERFGPQAFLRNVTAVYDRVWAQASNSSETIM